MNKLRLAEIPTQIDAILGDGISLFNKCKAYKEASVQMGGYSTLFSEETTWASTQQCRMLGKFAFNDDPIKSLWSRQVT